MNVCLYSQLKNITLSYYGVDVVYFNSDQYINDKTLKTLKGLARCSQLKMNKIAWNKIQYFPLNGYKNIRTVLGIEKYLLNVAIYTMKINLKKFLQHH